MFKNSSITFKSIKCFGKISGSSISQNENTINDENDINDLDALLRLADSGNISIIRV